MSLFLFDRIEGNKLYLEGNTASHILKSFRMKTGDSITATDGAGSVFTGIIAATGKGCVEVNVLDVKKKRSEQKITVACSLLKKDGRFENFVEKSTELGVSGIVPLVCDHSVKTRFRKDRVEKIMVAAAQQSLNPWHPVLWSESRFKEFIAGNTHRFEEKYIAYAPDRDNIKSLEESYNGGTSVCVLIGPEGDFSEEELEQAVGEGWNPVSLGSTRLRTETAAIVAVQILKSTYKLKTVSKE